MTHAKYASRSRGQGVRVGRIRVSVEQQLKNLLGDLQGGPFLVAQDGKFRLYICGAAHGDINTLAIGETLQELIDNAQGTS